MSNSLSLRSLLSRLQRRKEIKADSKEACGWKMYSVEFYPWCQHRRQNMKWTEEMRDETLRSVGVQQGSFGQSSSRDMARSWLLGAGFRENSKLALAVIGRILRHGGWSTARYTAAPYVCTHESGAFSKSRCVLATEYTSFSAAVLDNDNSWCWMVWSEWSMYVRWGGN